MELKQTKQCAPFPRSRQEHVGGLVWSGTCAPALHTYGKGKKERREQEREREVESKEEKKKCQ